jgi:hypothetical protein
MLMLSCCIVNGETSYLGEKLLSYVDCLPDSYSLIYTKITPVNDENYNYFANETDSPNCPVANIEIILYARTPDNRLIEKYNMMYDMSVLKNPLRTIKVGNQKESHYYFPKGNACQIDESCVMLYEESYTIMDNKINEDRRQNAQYIK